MYYLVEFSIPGWYCTRKIPDTDDPFVRHRQRLLPLYLVIAYTITP